ncbi:MAG: hypothetical protein HUU49_00050 [Candidatus Buchananbacteria bacterium]|nr:hypothetical protein [Candidatus Buchananbacteria bacterium]
MAGTLWINVDSASADTLADVARKLFPELEIRVTNHGDVSWLAVRGNGQVDDLRSFLKGVKSIR